MPELPSAEAIDGRRAPERQSAKATEQENPKFKHVSENAGKQATQQAGTQTGEPEKAKDYTYNQLNMHAREGKRQTSEL